MSALSDQLRIDAVEIEGWGAGNEGRRATQAADEIERLTADNARLRESLRSCQKLIARLIEPDMTVGVGQMYFQLKMAEVNARSLLPPAEGG